MNRLNRINPETADEPAASLLSAVKSKFGIAPNLTRVMANEPSVLKAYLGLGETLNGGHFSPKTREAVALTVAGANGCEYCAVAHTTISTGLKVDPVEIERQLKGDSSDPKLAALLAFTTAIVEKRGRVSDAEIAAVRLAGFSDSEIVELVAHISENIFTNYMNSVADSEVDFPSTLPGVAA